MKNKVYDTCVAMLDERIHSLRQQLHELVEGAKNDSKSTAGDKHETARAMMQIEQEKLANQLNLLLAQEQSLKRIDPQAKHDVVANGSLVKTDRGYIFIGVPLGKVKVDGVDVMCLTMQSPLGVQMNGRRAGERVVVNGFAYLLAHVE